MKTGLVSVSFRKLSAEEIIRIVAEAGLDGIEWGGDIHVPHGNDKKADEIRRLTLDAGLNVAAYGSYYRLAQSLDQRPAFEEVLSTAFTLGAPIIRVWAGDMGSRQADQRYWKNAIEDCRRICNLAAQANLIIATEYHVNTLTDSKLSVRKLLDDVNCRNFKTLWQPVPNESLAENMERLSDILDKLANVHVFCWSADHKRHLLYHGRKEWTEFFHVLQASTSEHYALLEFFEKDSLDNFFNDAFVLKEMASI
jgi:3-dehydroshikimate dehydratase